MAAKKIDPKQQAWIVARQRHRLSHAHVQMARELGMNPTRLGSIDNHRQEPWKAPLPEFIEHLYEKRFGKTRPDVVKTIEEAARASTAKEAARKARKKARRAERDAQAQPDVGGAPETGQGSRSANREATQDEHLRRGTATLAVETISNFHDRFEGEDETMEWYDGPLCGWLRERASGEWYAFDVQCVVDGALWHWTLIPSPEKGDLETLLLHAATGYDGAWISIVEDHRDRGNPVCHLVRYGGGVMRPPISTAKVLFGRRREAADRDRSDAGA